MDRESPFAVCVEAWFDGEKHHRGPAVFLVVDGRIAAVEEGERAAALTARGVPVTRGGFLLPGLVDAHVHLFLDGAPTDAAARSAHLKLPPDQLTEAARGSARQALACGVTLVRDAGDRHGINNLIRAEAAVASDMARVRSGGLGVKRPRRYGAFMAMDVDDAQSIRDSVARLAADNDEIKLILTGIIDFEAGAVLDEPQFDLEAARLVVETARAHGRSTFAHCSGVKGLEVAVGAGVGAIEHGFFMQRDILSRMRDKDVAWTPTFGPVQFQWQFPQAVGWSPQVVDKLRRILDAHAEHLRLADSMGVTLLMGTDAGSMGVEHGYAMFDEIDRYLEAGLSLEATLRAATGTARRRFGLAHATLTEGAPFDAVLLDRSPFDDLRALRRPTQVWREGAR